MSGRHYEAREPRLGASLVLAHGAGAPHTHPFLVGFGRGLASHGIDVVTFNFPYMEAKRRTPDRTAVLEACFLAIIGRVRELDFASDARLFAGGKSMGGRMASHVAAHHASEAGPLGGLVFLGYPLHPPNRPDKLRDEHLVNVAVPMLFVQGTRDAFGTPEELRPVLAQLGSRAELLVVEGGDHSLAVPRNVSASQNDVLARVQGSIADWIRGCISRQP